MCVCVSVCVCLSHSTHLSYVGFIVGDKCDVVNNISNQFPGLVPDGNPHCFAVTTELKEGCWVLGLSTVTYLTVSYTLTRVCDRAIEERERMYHRLLTSPRKHRTASGTLKDMRGGLSDSESDDSESEEEQEDVHDKDRPFVNCDDKCGQCLFACFERLCFVRARRKD